MTSSIFLSIGWRFLLQYFKSRKFIVVLQGQDYENRLHHLESMRTIFERTFTQDNVDPWENYSASVGMAEYASDDSTVELVFKRADKAMYEEKQAFNKKYGSYR